jgi:hypothetical protein
VRSPVSALVVILLVVAGVGIGLSVALAGANMITAGIGMASVLVAAIGIVCAPWLAPRSGPAGVACSLIGLGGVTIAALLLLSSPASNSDLWVLINLGRFGGVIVAILGLALTVHAAVLGRLGLSRAVGLALADILALAIGIVFAGWETRV